MIRVNLVATIESATRSYLARVVRRFLPLWIAGAATAATLLFVAPASDIGATDSHATNIQGGAGRTASALPPVVDMGELLPPAGAALAAAGAAPPNTPSQPPPAPPMRDGGRSPQKIDDDGGTSLFVGDGVWASRTGGTPFAATGVPPATLPVGQRGGVPDKASFVRLQGRGTVLTLSENPNGRRNAVGEAAIEACQIVERQWEGSDGMSLDEAPRWDPQACVAAKASTTGDWTFDLARFENPSDSRGFALVPVADAVDFQVTFVLHD